MEDKMMKTPEQEFLKALAVDLIDHKHFLEDEILNACKKYLASLEQNQCDITEKVEPTWTPEVGRLYRHSTIENHYLSYEGFNQIGYNHKIRVETEHHINHGECFYISDSELKKLVPVAELEGLEVGDNVYGLDNDGKVIPWLIAQGRGNKDSLFCRCGWQVLSVKHDGQPVFLGNGQQLFWRTADRAERFGRE